MSNYITKDHANIIAKEMVKKMNEKIRLKEEDLSQYITEQYNATLPKDVLSLFNQYPNYFRKAGRVLLKGNGLNSGFNLLKSVCAVSDYQIALQPDPAAAKIISKSLSEIEKLETKRNQLKVQIEQTLLSLKTYKRIEDQFPEAFALIPQRGTINAVAIPIDDIRKQLGAIK